MRVFHLSHTDLDGYSCQLITRRFFDSVHCYNSGYGPEVTANLELWSELYAIDHSPAEAWVGLLSVLLRDPLFLVY